MPEHQSNTKKEIFVALKYGNRRVNNVSRRDLAGKPLDNSASPFARSYIFPYYIFWGDFYLQKFSQRFGPKAYLTCARAIACGQHVSKFTTSSSLLRQLKVNNSMMTIFTAGTTFFVGFSFFRHSFLPYSYRDAQIHFPLGSALSIFVRLCLRPLSHSVGAVLSYLLAVGCHKILHFELLSESLI